MGNPYYHDAYYGLDGLGEILGPIVPILIVLFFTRSLWQGTFIEDAKEIIGWLLKLFAPVLIVVIVAFAFRFLHIVILLFLIGCFVNDYHRKHKKQDERPGVLNAASELKSNVEDFVIKLPEPPVPLSEEWVYSDLYSSDAPINEFLINRLTRFAEGNSYYIYYKHGHTNDVLSKGQEWINYSTYFQYDIIPETGDIAHIICRAVIANKGVFAYYPQSIQYIYKNGASEECSCNGYEILGKESAAESVFNESAPHPKCPWSRIKGSLDIS